MTSPKTVLFIAGESSGDQHGAAVARAFHQRRPDVRMIGTGGPEMEAAGVDLFAELDDLAVMGFVEVLGRLDFFRALERRIEAMLASGTIDLVILVDYPGFNMRVTKMAKRLGVPTLFYIAPQVWAWRRHRAKTLAETADRLAVILPFEVPIFEEHGARVSFVGHPLVDHRTAAELEVLSGTIDPTRPLLALLPGSRSQEVSRHLGLMLESAELLRRTEPTLQVAVAQASGVTRFAVPEDVATVRGGRQLLAAADVAIVKSGTSTLEAALAGVPFVCVYRTHPVTFALAKRLVKLDHVALANLVAGGEVVPEFIQDRFTPRAVADALRALLPADSSARATMEAQLAGVRGKLGTPGAAERVADMACQLLHDKGS